MEQTVINCNAPVARRIVNLCLAAWRLKLRNHSHDFRVRAKNDDGEWQAAQATLSVGKTAAM